MPPFRRWLLFFVTFFYCMFSWSVSSLSGPSCRRWLLRLLSTGLTDWNRTELFVVVRYIPKLCFDAFGPVSEFWTNTATGDDPSPFVDVFPFQVTSYQQDSNEALEELLNFVLLACGATATDGPYRPPEVF